MIKNIIIILGIGFLNPVFAESSAYDVTTNVLTIPFVQVDNENFSDVTFACNPDDNFSCKLLGAVASNCSSGTYEDGGSTENTYFIRTRSADGVQFGGISLSNPDGNPFMVSWIKSSKDQNPYLVDEDLSQFTDNVAYGVVGGGVSRLLGDFEVGDLVTVTGDSTGYFVQEVNGDATATFNNGIDISVNNSCNSLSGEYLGNIGSSGTSNIYSINIINNTDGSIQLANSDGGSFTASWDGTNKFLNKYSRASLGSISSFYYSEFDRGVDSVFVTDIGNGIALTVVDTFTGKVNATAVFMQR